VDDYFAGSLPRTQAPAAPAAPSTSYPPPGGFPPPVQQPFQPFPPPSAAPEPPPFARQGWAPPPGSVPQQPWGAPPPAAGGNRKLVVGVAAGVALLLLVMVGSAVQVFMKQRGIAKRTTVAVPQQVLGMPKLSGTVADAAESRLHSFPGPGDAVTGVYGDGQVTVIVLAAKYPMSGRDQRDFLSASKDEARDQGMPLHDVRPGALGGTLRCGTHATLPMVLCAFSDAGSYGVVAVAGPAADAEVTARGAREAFVHRS
jgi:hypothetical protein